MASVEQRFKSLLQRHLGITDSAAMHSTLSDLGVNSVDAIAFLKAVCKEFGTDFKPEDVANFANLQAAVDHIEASA